MRLRELWRRANTIYNEVSFQSVYSLRAGSMLPQREKTDIKRLISRAKTNVIISKILTGFFIGFFAITMFTPFIFLNTQHNINDLALVSAVSIFLGTVLFLIMIMGLQVTTSFVSSEATELLTQLPLSKREISNILFLVFIRIFDIPLVTAPAAFLAAYFFTGGSIFGGLAALAGIIATEIFALTISIAMSKFFYSRITSSGGRSKWKTLLRFILMLVWVLPTFGAYFITSFSSYVVQAFASLSQVLSSSALILTAVFPFCYGFLTSFATLSQNIDYAALGLSLASSIVYLALAMYSYRWLANTVRSIGLKSAISVTREKVTDTIIRPATAWLGIIRKDLRIASRTPSLASIFIFPAIETVALALSFSSFQELGINTALGVLTGISFIIPILPTMLFSIEGLSIAYTRSLPISKRVVVSSKTLLSILTYVASLIVLLAIALILGRNLTYILIFGAIHTMSIAATSMLELTLLIDKFWKSGAIGNMYSRLLTWITILVPGFIVVYAPIMAALVTYMFSPSVALLTFFGVAALEFMATLLVVLLKK